jgi:hypothetical protein
MSSNRMEGDASDDNIAFMLIMEEPAVQKTWQTALESVCLSAELGSRIWYEWIDITANAADGLPRCGAEGPIAQALCATITEVEPLTTHGCAHAFYSLRSSISP